MENLSIVDKVRVTALKKNRLPLIMGLPLGAFVPFGVFMIVHTIDLSMPLSALTVVSVALSLGGLVYSASTVYQWMRVAVGSPVKALGFTVLVEGIMTFSQIDWLAYIALSYLIVMNAVATACTLACDRDHKRAVNRTRNRRVTESQPRLRRIA